MLLPALLLAGLIAPAATTAATVAAPAAATGRLQLGEQQRLRFERRLELLTMQIDRQRALGLPEGRAAFMRQDLARVATGIAAILRVQGYLSPAEDRSYTASLGQVARKLARAQAERAPQLVLVARR